MKKVAALVTEYRKWSHADVILTKVLEGYNLDGGDGPGMKLAGLYVDQFPQNDTSRSLAKKHGFTIYPTIREALTLGGPKLAVDGVLSIGEHGRYPTSPKGQLLYPRRRFFEGIVDVFASSKKVVPVFNDKHLSASWTDTRWMYDRSRELFIPLMAGSSLPLTWRRPELTLPRGCELVEAVQLCYGHHEAYGFHALEAVQCMAERRKGDETGVLAVQALKGPAMWESLDTGKWSKELLDAALALVPAHAAGDIRTLTAKVPSAAVWLIEYRDGFRAAVANLNGWVHEGDGGAFVFAGKLKGVATPAATHFYLQNLDPFAHFAWLLRAIDSMFHTNHPPYPVERSLLTTGILDAAMTSAAEGGRRVETPHLAIAYRAKDWPHASGPVPKAVTR